MLKGFFEKQQFHRLHHPFDLNKSIGRYQILPSNQSSFTYKKVI